MFKGNSQSGFEIVSLSVCPKKQLMNILQEKYIKKLIKSNVVDFDCEFFQNIKDKIEYYKRIVLIRLKLKYTEYILYFRFIYNTYVYVFYFIYFFKNNPYIKK